MRIAALCALSLLLAACSTPTTPDTFEVSIKGVRLRHMVREDFIRIAEYRTGLEYRGNRLILRSQPESREGMYFILLLDKNVRQIYYGTQIVLEVLTPYDPLPKSYVYELPPERPATREAFIGLTGDDWQDSSDVPIAWRITLKRRDKVYDVHESYLWTFDEASEPANPDE